MRTRRISTRTCREVTGKVNADARFETGKLVEPSKEAPDERIDEAVA
jgi:hypothetical protein